MSELREYIVTLYSKDDLDGFYEDMETPGGSITIPNRRVDVSNRRAISRNTHYMLTEEEARMVAEDVRVWDVLLHDIEVNAIMKPSYLIDNGDFNKSTVNNVNHKNWGLLRHTENSVRSGHGFGETTSIVDDVTITASGKHVDVLIVDGFLSQDHPEFLDANSLSRVIQYNWFQNDIGDGYTGTYTYPTPSLSIYGAEHGNHVAGTVAGNTQGWARDARIFNITPYSSDPNWREYNGGTGPSISTMWDYIRAWHNSKPINNVTGRRNPTVSNHSYGSAFTFPFNGGANSYETGPVTRTTYRTTDFNPGRNLTQSELQERGFYAPNSIPRVTVPYYSTSRQADILDALDDGIITVFAAGNDEWRVVTPSDQDWANLFYATYGLTNSDGDVISASNYTWWTHRGSGSGSAYEGVINVGSLSFYSDERKASYSNTGTAIDVYAAGDYIQSSGIGSGNVDPRDPSSSGPQHTLFKNLGTSMAAPQVAGTLACLAEVWPNMTHEEAHEYVISTADIDVMRDDYVDGVDDAQDLQSLQGGPNRILRWRNQRPETGNNFPRLNIKQRPATGGVYPRQRIRRHG